MEYADIRPFRCLPCVRVIDVSDHPELSFLLGEVGEVCDVGLARTPYPISISVYRHSGTRYAFRPDQLQIIDEDEGHEIFERLYAEGWVGMS